MAETPLHSPSQIPEFAQSMFLGDNCTGDGCSSILRTIHRSDSRTVTARMIRAEPAALSKIGDTLQEGSRKNDMGS